MLPTTMIGLLIVKLQPHLEKVSFMMFGLAGILGNIINKVGGAVNFIGGLFKALIQAIKNIFSLKWGNWGESLYAW
jgi:hypothetical protein